MFAFVIYRFVGMTLYR